MVSPSHVPVFDLPMMRTVLHAGEPRPVLFCTVAGFHRPVSPLATFRRKIEGENRAGAIVQRNTDQASLPSRSRFKVALNSAPNIIARATRYKKKIAVTALASPA